MKKWAVAAACALVASIVLYVTVFRSSEEDRIREVVNRFTKVCEVKANDNVLMRAGRLQSTFEETVDDGVRVDIEELGMGISGREKLVENGTRAAGLYNEATIELSDIKIKIDDSKTTAKCDAVAQLKTKDRSDKRDVHFLLRKDGGWKITTLSVMSPKWN